MAAGALAFASPRRVARPGLVRHPRHSVIAKPSAPAAPAARLNRRPALDGIRACAVLAVMYFHAALWVPKPLRFYGGFMGVDVFFVLSGYLITTLLIREYRQEGRIDLGGFYARRGLRILPALTLAVLLAAAVGMYLGGNLGTRSILEVSVIAFSFLGNWFQAARGLGLLGHTWSLAVEEQFYLLWPAILFLLLRKRRSLAAVGRCLFLLAAVAVAMRFAMFFGGHAESATYSSVSRTDGILLGSALALALADHHSVVARVMRYSAVGIFGALALLAFTAGCGHGISGTWCGAPGASISATILIGHLATNSTSVIAAALSFRPLRAIGRISYGMYLFHWPIVVLLRSWTPWGVGHLAVLVGATLALAIPSYLLIERPLMRVYGRIRTKRDERLTAVTAEAPRLAAA